MYYNKHTPVTTMCTIREVQIKHISNNKHTCTNKHTHIIIPYTVLDWSGDRESTGKCKNTTDSS